MGYNEIRVYGYSRGLTAEQAKELVEKYAFTEHSFAEGTLDFGFEGNYFFIEDFLEDLEQCLDADAKAGVDYIDQYEFTMQRHTRENGEWNCKNINLNDVLERYNHEF